MKKICKWGKSVNESFRVDLAVNYVVNFVIASWRVSISSYPFQDGPDIYGFLNSSIPFDIY